MKRKIIKNQIRQWLMPLLLLWCMPILHAQEMSKTLTGTVKTQSGQPLSGASIQIKGGGASVVTKEDGTYELKLPSGNVTVVVSYVGYVSREYVTGGRNAMDLVLLQDPAALSDVVVVGYGTSRKSDLTGSVVSVKSDAIRSMAITSFDQALQGRASGVVVTQVSGKPGAESSIRIRGTSSINADNEPLYVIDGMLMNSSGGDMSAGGVTRGPRISPLSSLNPSDIESMEILKDASATAIYGSRGTNGVILITTKKGKSGKGKLTYESYYGMQQSSRKLELLNAAEFAGLVNEARANSGLAPVYQDPKSLGEGTDWQGELMGPAPITNHQLSFMGGTDKISYSISGSYFDQEGIVMSSRFTRYNFRANIEAKMTDKLTVGTSLIYSRSKSIGVLTNAGDIIPGVVTGAMLFNPVLPVYDPAVKGGYTFENDRGKILGNPIAEAKEFKSETYLNRLIGNFFIKYDLNKYLNVKTTFGIDDFLNNENSFGPNFLKRTEGSRGVVILGRSNGLNWLNENTINYNRTFKSRHQINAVAGFTAQHSVIDKLTASSFDFSDGRTGFYNIGTGAVPQKSNNVNLDWSILSLLGRINYSLDGKYLFTLTGRRDGSSKFSQGNKYGFFPSAAAAWRISKEKFMDDITWISDLKLRASYGIVGNQGILSYQSLALVNSYGQGVFNSPTGFEVYNGREPASYSNPNLLWETTRQMDIGLDVSLFGGRVSMTADYYEKNTYDLLLSTPISWTTGFASTLLNVGNINNKGFDFELHTINMKGKFSWNTDVNFSLNRNKVTNLNNGADILFGPLQIRKGQSVSTFYGYEFLGIFQTNQEAATSPVLLGQEPTAANVAARAKAGDRKYKDVNGDGRIDANDRIDLGTALPKFTWGISNQLSYENFDLSFFFQSSIGNKIANLNNLDLYNFSGQNNVLREAGLNRWTPQNPSNTYARAVASGVIDYGQTSSAIIEDASYVRLRNISLSYTVPPRKLRAVSMSNLSFYISATNLLTFTNYTGYDPEANTFGQNTTIVGIDQGGYPQAKTFQFGVSATF